MCDLHFQYDSGDFLHDTGALLENTEQNWEWIKKKKENMKKIIKRPTLIVLLKSNGNTNFIEFAALKRHRTKHRSVFLYSSKLLYRRCCVCVLVSMCMFVSICVWPKESQVVCVCVCVCGLWLANNGAFSGLIGAQRLQRVGARRGNNWQLDMRMTAVSVRERDSVSERENGRNGAQL